MSTSVNNSNVLRVIAVAYLNDMSNNKHSVEYEYLCKIRTFEEGTVEYNDWLTGPSLTLGCKAELLTDSEIELLSTAKIHGCFKTVSNFSKGNKMVCVELTFDNDVLVMRKYISRPLGAKVINSEEVSSKYPHMLDLFLHSNQTLSYFGNKDVNLFTKLSDFK
jgi:hypothetical protein